MHIRPELRGGKLPHISALVAVVLALTIEPVDSLAPDNAYIAPEPKISKRNVGVRSQHGKVHNHPRLPARARRPREFLSPEEIAARQVSPEEFAAWSKVAVCEEGGDWHVEGPDYSGGIGISTDNWIAYGGRFFAPTGARATPQEQIVIGKRIQPNPPDQNGCEGAW